MAELKDIVAYLCDRYPYAKELSNARLTKMVYLADWKSAIERGEQLTNLSWEFSHYGPYVPDVIRLARSEEDFEVERGETIYGGEKELVRHKAKSGTAAGYPSLEPGDKDLLDFVVRSVEDKSFTEFVKLVYSTYPIVTQERYSKLDLASLAKQYEEVAPLLSSS
jgi:antitoxin SocA-like protein